MNADKLEIEIIELVMSVVKGLFVLLEFSYVQCVIGDPWTVYSAGQARAACASDHHSPFTVHRSPSTVHAFPS
jgi:hypothetical protein